MNARAIGLLQRLPLPVRRVLTPARLVLLAEFLRFGTVGFVGFLVDALAVYALRGRFGLVAAGLMSYCVAASANWVLNRVWTFRGQGRGAWHVQWARFMAVNLGGAVLNRGTYLVLISVSPVCAAAPVLAVAAGAVAGMFVNFGLSRRLVFR